MRSLHRDVERGGVKVDTGMDEKSGYLISRQRFILVSKNQNKTKRLNLELVSKELDHFGVIAGLFRQIGGHSSRFVLFCFF